MILLGLAIAGSVTLWSIAPGGTTRLLAQEASLEQATGSGERVATGIFTTAHRSMGEAIRHFLGLRDDPEQPIAFSHQLHVQEVGVGCEFCHNGVSVSPNAGIPNVETCMLCHSEVGRDLPEVQALVDYYDGGLEPPWERVYGWYEEPHVWFTHQPHYTAGVGCETCHGNVQTMEAAERAVDHTMSFCVNCHVENQASYDCVTCHN